MNAIEVLDELVRELAARDVRASRRGDALVLSDIDYTAALVADDGRVRIPAICARDYKRRAINIKPERVNSAYVSVYATEIEERAELVRGDKVAS